MKIVFEISREEIAKKARNKADLLIDTRLKEAILPSIDKIIHDELKQHFSNKTEQQKEQIILACMERILQKEGIPALDRMRNRK